jgi:hypothetical protein
METKIIVMLIFGLLFSGLAASASIGAAPSSINMGDVEPGETVDQEIYIRVSDIDENFTLTPYANGISPTTLFDDYEGDRLSESSGASWWDIEESQINPDTEIPESEIDVENDNLPTIQGVTTATLSVPDNAEPGVRRGHINLDSDLSGSGTGPGASAGARFIAPTRISYQFNVPGNVQRDVVVQDVRGFRTEPNSASVELLLSNEGTVTVTSQSFDFDVLGPRGDTVETLSASGVTLEPGESEWTNAYWSGGSVDEGTFQVDGQVDYITGSAYASGSFSLGDVVEVRPSDSPTTDDETQEGGGVPIWFVVIVLVILGVLMWGFEIEPFWIVAILGVVGISAFILLSGLPNFLLAVLLIMVGIIIYGGM